MTDLTLVTEAQYKSYANTVQRHHVPIKFVLVRLGNKRHYLGMDADGRLVSRATHNTPDDNESTYAVHADHLAWCDTPEDNHAECPD